MATATKFRDRPHARVYAHWRQFPAWALLSLVARALLVEILMEYRPGANGRLAWSCRKAARSISVSKDRAARALIELEMKGWLTVERVANFGRRNLPAEYALTMYANDVNGAPASFAFEAWNPAGLPAPIACPCRASGTRRSHFRDTAVAPEGHGDADQRADQHFRRPQNVPRVQGNCRRRRQRRNAAREGPQLAKIL